MGLSWRTMIAAFLTGAVTDAPPLSVSDDGTIRVADTRIPLELLIRAFLTGATPEQMVMDYDVLKLEDVYAVINHYLHHRREVDAYLAEQASRAARSRAELERICDPVALRQRLMARRSIGE